LGAISIAVGQSAGQSRVSLERWRERWAPNPSGR
jgi:hypothetical protein